MLIYIYNFFSIGYHRTINGLTQHVDKLEKIKNIHNNKYYSHSKMISKIKQLEDILLFKLGKKYKKQTQHNINLMTHMVDEISRQLTENDLKTLNQIELEELAEMMFLAHERSRVPSEDRVGLKSGQYLGNIATQTSLDSKHAAGIKKDVNIMKAIESVVNFTLRTDSDIIVYFDKRKSARDVLKDRYKIKPTYLEDVIDNIEGKTSKEYSKDTWETLFEIIYQQEYDVSSNWVSIDVDLSQIKIRGLSLKYISEKITSIFPNYSVIYNSLTGEMKLFHQFNDLTEIQMNKSLIPKLKRIKISGVPFVENIYPVKINRLKAITKIANGIIYIDADYMVKYNLSYKLLRDYIEERIEGEIIKISSSEFKILNSKIKEDDIMKEINNFNVKLEDIVKKGKIMKYKDIIDLPEGYEINGNKLETKKRSDIYVFLRKYYEKSVMIYFEVESTASKKSIDFILEFDDVDQDYTYEDNINYILNTAGIEAARCYYVDKLVQLFGGNIDKLHIELLADVATYKGKKISTLRYGHEEMATSWIDAATFEEAQKNLLERAAIGNRDDLKSLSAQRLTGSLINMNKSFELMNK
jgi:hypothetical protein